MGLNDGRRDYRGLLRVIQPDPVKEMSEKLISEAYANQERFGGRIEFGRWVPPEPDKTYPDPSVYQAKPLPAPTGTDAQKGLDVRSAPPSESSVSDKKFPPENESRKRGRPAKRWTRKSGRLSKRILSLIQRGVIEPPEEGEI